jgi:hypothetical protein
MRFYCSYFYIIIVIIIMMLIIIIIIIIITTIITHLIRRITFVHRLHIKQQPAIRSR